MTHSCSTCIHIHVSCDWKDVHPLSNFLATGLILLIFSFLFKKFMQVGVDVTCMLTNFGGRGLSGFRENYLMVHKSGKFQSIGIG